MTDVPFDQECSSDSVTIKAIRAIESVFVRHRAVESTLARLEIVRMAGASGGSAKCFFLLGQSGAGKSQILKRFASAHPRMTLPDRDEIPVLYMQMPARTTPKSVCEQVLLQLDCPYSNRGSLPERELRAIQQLRAARTQVLIFDEFHNLLDRRTQRVAHDAATFVRALLNAAVSAIVLCGITEAEAVISQEPQLRRRSIGRIDLQPFDWNTEQGRTEFRAILHQFDKALPFPARSGLSELNMAHRIHYASEGLIGIVAQLLIVASIKSGEFSLDRITKECLADAFDEVRKSDKINNRNPFRQDRLPYLKVVEGEK